MKKQIVAMMMILSTVAASQAQAQTGVSDNLQKIGQSDVPDNMLSLLTALRAYSVQNNTMDLGESNVSIKGFGDCSNEELVSGTCVKDMYAMTTVVVNITLPQNKVVRFTNQGCGRDLVVREPRGSEIRVEGAYEFEQSGQYNIEYRGFNNCSVQVLLTGK